MGLSSVSVAGGVEREVIKHVGLRRAEDLALCRTAQEQQDPGRSGLCGGVALRRLSEVVWDGVTDNPKPLQETFVQHSEQYLDSYPAFEMCCFFTACTDFFSHFVL